MSKREGRGRRGGKERERNKVEREREEKKRQTSGMDDQTVGKDVEDRVLSKVAEKTGRDELFSNEVLVTHTAGGSEGVVNEGKLVKTEG